MKTQARILVLDDDYSVRMAVVAVLTRPEWDVDSAGSAEEALDLCKDASYDMMIVDKNLPGMSGVDFVRQIRKKGSDTAVIMITGYASATSALEMLHLGLDAYVEKPFDDIFEITRMTESSLEKLKARRASLGVQQGGGGDLDKDLEADSALKEAGGHFKKARKMMPTSRPPEARKCKILIASPGAYERNWLSRQLDEWGDIKCTESSKELLELLTDEEPDLIVLDFQLSKPDVYDLLPQIKALVPKAANLIVLEDPPFTTLTRLIDLEISGVIEKPFVKKAIKKEISKLVRLSMFPLAPY